MSYYYRYTVAGAFSGSSAGRFIFNYKNTLVNFSFARMRKKYIEDNDEQDPELIRKVAPFYQRTSQILGGTQVAFVIYCGILPSVFWGWRRADAICFLP